MKVFKWDDYYDTEHCPHCGRLRLMIARTEYGTKRVCDCKTKALGEHMMF
nr:MAG TPA: Protein of unknown function (DUF983) [Caudoviricetes sp.]